MVRVQYLKGKYTELEILELLNSKKDISSKFSNERDKLFFAQMLKAKISVKNITYNNLIKLIDNRP